MEGERTLIGWTPSNKLLVPSRRNLAAARKRPHYVAVLPLPPPSFSSIRDERFARISGSPVPTVIEFDVDVYIGLISWSAIDPT